MVEKKEFVILLIKKKISDDFHASQKDCMNNVKAISEE